MQGLSPPQPHPHYCPPLIFFPVTKSKRFPFYLAVKLSGPYATPTYLKKKYPIFLRKHFSEHWNRLGPALSDKSVVTYPVPASTFVLLSLNLLFCCISCPHPPVPCIPSLPVVIFFITAVHQGPVSIKKGQPSARLTT